MRPKPWVLREPPNKPKRTDSEPRTWNPPSSTSTQQLHAMAQLPPSAPRLSRSFSNRDCRRHHLSSISTSRTTVRAITGGANYCRSHGTIRTALSRQTWPSLRHNDAEAAGKPPQPALRTRNHSSIPRHRERIGFERRGSGNHKRE